MVGLVVRDDAAALLARTVRPIGFVPSLADAGLRPIGLSAAPPTPPGVEDQVGSVAGTTVPGTTQALVGFGALVTTAKVVVSRHVVLRNGLVARLRLGVRIS